MQLNHGFPSFQLVRISIDVVVHCLYCKLWIFIIDCVDRDPGPALRVLVALACDEERPRREGGGGSWGGGGCLGVGGCPSRLSCWAYPRAAPTKTVSEELPFLSLLLWYI